MSEAPTTWRLLEAFERCLQRITVADGFHTDAGLYVTREPHQIPAHQPALVAAVLEELGRPNDPGLSRTHRLATVLLVGKVPTGLDDAQLQLHLLMEDIDRAFDGQQARFPAGLQFPQFVSSRPIPPAEGLAWIGAEVRYSSHVPRQQ